MVHRVSAAGKSDARAQRLRPGLALLCLGALSACQLESDVHSPTRLVLSIEVERALRVRSQQLQVAVAQAGSSLAAAGVEPQQLERLVLAGDDRVKQLTITPQGGQKAPYVCVTVTAREAQAEPLAVVQARVVTRYVRGETREVRLVLRADCLAVACKTGETCEAGSCVPALRHPQDLPLFHATDAGRIQEAAAPDAAAAPAPDAAGAVDTSEPPILTHVSQIVAQEADAGPSDPCAAAHGGCDARRDCLATDGGPKGCEPE